LQGSVGHGGVGAQDEDGRLSTAFLLIEEEVIGLHHITAQARQHRKTKLVLRHKLLAVLRGIGANGQKLGVLLLEIGQFLLEGVELEVTYGAPLPPEEEQDRLTAAEMVVQAITLTV
jgi:hypothetical protein